MGRNRAVLRSLGIAVVVAGMGGLLAAPSGAVEPPPVGPEGVEFYLPPDPLPPGAPGDLIWYREIGPDDEVVLDPLPPTAHQAPTPDVDAEPPSDAEATALSPGPRRWRVLYRSTTYDGREVAVSGFVVAPEHPAPPGGWPVESYGHGTTGIGNCDAPSRYPFGERAEHRVLAITDYEGLGTPGPHPYLVGAAAGHNMLDIARAAAQIPDLEVSDRVVLSGFSQGGHATLFAGELAASYAPELDVVGTIASAPPTEMDLNARFVTSVPAALGYGLYMMWGVAHAHGFPLWEVLTPAAIAALEAEATCELVPGVPSVWGIPAGEAFHTVDPVELPPAWMAAFEASVAGQLPSVPVFVYAGEHDPVVPLGTIERYVPRACSHGTHVTFLVDPTGGHQRAGAEGDQWVEERLAGAPLGPSSCDALGGEEPPPADPIVVVPTFTG